jgi:putative toxin-antitoxin system antitoxin component (TIGR02293 family)
VSTANTDRHGVQIKKTPTHSKNSSKSAPVPPKTRKTAAQRKSLMGLKRVNVTKAKSVQTGKGIEQLVQMFVHWTPYERIEHERRGVGGAVVKSLARTLGMSHLRMFEVIGIPKATAEKKAATNSPITGAAGQSALGMVRLLAVAREIVANSDSARAKDFDTAKWLGSWIEKPQPALGGRRPAEMLDTPTGIETVVKLLGALESGAYL